LKFNDIVFWYEPTRPALASCAEFLKSIALCDQQRIKKIVVVEKLKDGDTPWHGIGRLLMGNLYPTIQEFCARYAGTQVILRLDTPVWKMFVTMMYYRKYTIQHAALRMALRGSYDVNLENRIGLWDDI
jgi:hypothetical protein